MSAVSSVVLKLCSNSTVKVKRKTKEDHTGKSPRWWFVIHDTEESLQALDLKWHLVQIQTN